MSNPPADDPGLEAPNPAVVHSVQLKIPPFWPTDPQLWFAQVEAQFSTRGISAQKTKFDYVVSSLDHEFAQEVRDLLLSPPTTTPYTKLKEQLIERTAASEQRRLQQLFHSEDLGDRKPSQLLRRMQQLLGDKMNSTDASFLRELFLQRLPSNVRMLLAATGDSKMDLPELAQLADKIMEVAVTPASNISSATLVQNPSSELQSLRSELSDLRHLVERLLSTKPQHRRHRTPSRGRSPTPNPTPASSTLTAQSACWYHQRYGSSARKCQSPCSYVSENDQASH